MAVASPSLPVQILLGIYLGILTGILPALVTWALAFTFKYVTGLTVPSFAVVVLGVAMAGVNGGFLAFNDPSVVQSSNSVVLITAILVVMLVGFYAHNMGDKLGASIPKRLSLRGLRERTLSADVVELVEGRNRVRVTVVGEVEDMEGYPPLSPDLRAELRETVREWTFPADLTIPALEAAVADRLREEFALSDVVVTLDEQARASVVAAPPFSGVSRHVPEGHRAISLEGLVPSGVAPGEAVTVVADGVEVRGTLLGARVDGEATTASAPTSEPQSDTPATDGGTPADADAPAATDPEPATGGHGRLTVAVPRQDAQALLPVREGAIVVTSRGTRREFELLSLLRRAGQRIRRVTVTADGPLAGSTLGEAGVRERYGVAVLAVRRDGAWQFAPRGETALESGDALFVAGTRDALEAFREAAA